jgi:hypothetical protein
MTEGGRRMDDGRKRAIRFSSLILAKFTRLWRRQRRPGRSSFFHRHSEALLRLSDLLIFLFSESLLSFNYIRVPIHARYSNRAEYDTASQDRA